LQLEKVNRILIDFLKTVGNKCKLSAEDLNILFQYEVLEVLREKPNSIKIYIGESRPVDFELDSEINEVLGQNQIGKTTVLLYLANLLGYDFFDEDNKEFLKDEKLVLQGQKIFSKLTARTPSVKSKVEITTGNCSLSIWTEKGEICFEVTKGEELLTYKPWDLALMSERFRKAIKEYVDVQFISKGRNFDEQLLLDISNEMRFYLSKFHERAKYLMNNLNLQLEDLSKRTIVSEAVNLESRKQSIDAELKKVDAEHISNREKYSYATSRYEGAIFLLKELKDYDKDESFLMNRNYHQLSKELESARKRLQILNETIARSEEIDGRIRDLRSELNRLESNLSMKRQTYQKIKDEIDKLIVGFGSYTNKFLDNNNAFNFLKILKDSEIDEILHLRESADSEAEKAIESLYENIVQYNPDINITEFLGGTMGTLQTNVEQARKIIRDNNLIRSLTDSLLKVLGKEGILESELYKRLKESIQELERNKESLEKSISFDLEQKKTINTDHDKKLLEETVKKIEELELTIQKIKEKMDKFSEAEKNKISLFEKIAATLNTEDPKSLVYSNDWADKLLELRKNLETEITDLQQLDKVLLENKGQLSKEKNIIEEIQASPELGKLNERISGIDKFIGVLNTLDEILRNCKDLKNKEKLQKQLDILYKYDLDKAFYQAINDMFLERCKYYFEIIDENSFKKEIIFEFNYFDKWFGYDDKKQNIDGLSGGTASVMTVLSLASKKPLSKLGTILLVDEFQDVAETLRRETYKELLKNDSLSFSFFVRPKEDTPLILKAIDMRGE